MKLKANLSSSFVIISNLILFIVIMGSTVSCSKEPLYEEHLIKVDSISVYYLPILDNPNEIFSVNLHGTISTNGCSSLSYCKFSIVDQDLIIEAWKKTEVTAENCPTVMVYLDQRLIFSENQLPENFTIKIKQPDGTYLEKYMN